MPLRILVVEDHARFRHLICAALQQQAEFQTIEAADGLEGVQKAEAQQPDVILLDINLPQMHGFEAAQQIRRLAPNARLLFVSQESSPEIVRQALRLGALGYVQKISAATDLLPAIDAALAGKRFVSRSLEFTDPDDAPAPRRHEIRFCPDDAAVVESLTRCVAAVLQAGDAAIAVVTAPHRTDLLRELRTQGVDIDDAIARGTCCSFDADDASTPDRFLDAIDGVRSAAAKAGKPHPRVTLCGERAGRLWAAGRTAEAVELERFCDELAHDIDILCVYPVPYTNDDAELTRICGEHTTVR